MANTDTSWWSKDTVAVVIGANKGIGLEIVRNLADKGLTVVLTARDPTRGQDAVDTLKAQGLKSVFFHALDVISPESAKNLAKWLKEEFGGIDILVNNAAIGSDPYSYDTAKGIIDTNYRGVKSVTKTLLPLLRASPAGARIVIVTSRVGLYNRLNSDSLKQKFKDEGNYSEEMVESLATEYLEDVKEGRLEEKGWIPGPTHTDMLAAASKDGLIDFPEGFVAKTVGEGADTGVWLALLPKQELVSKNGKKFGERSEYSFGWQNPP